MGFVVNGHESEGKWSAPDSWDKWSNVIDNQDPVWPWGDVPD
jgi:hypothetical protein